MLSTYLLHDQIGHKWNLGPVTVDGQTIRRDDGAKYTSTWKLLFQALREKTGFNPGLSINATRLLSLDEQAVDDLIFRLQTNQDPSVGFSLEGNHLDITLD